MKKRTPTIFFGLILLFMLGCKKPYEPPEIKAVNNFLVVDGIINGTSGSATTITLSRTRRLIDTVTNVPEPFAQVSLENNSGGTYYLQDKGNGHYTIEQWPVDPATLYRLNITTADGLQYQSDFVPVKQPPPIDSLAWKQDKDVTVYAYAHDPQNNTRYYRWEYVETWEYHSFYETDLGVSNRRIFYRDSTTQAFKCWSTANSTDIILGSTVKLSEDVISHIPVAVIPEKSVKLKYRYSVLIKQYALTKEAYEYWQILQKNTQQLGSLFDAQPSQLVGNIHCISHPDEPVIGYVSASGVQEGRTFINNRDLVDWQGYPSGVACDVLFTTLDAADYLNFQYSDTTYGPYYFVTPGGLAVAKRNCLDCTLNGGTNKKPSFW